MTQLELVAECRVPTKGSMTWELLMALKNGERLTPLDALRRYACLSLSQRVSELKRSGWPILSRMVELPSGKKCCEYWMEHGN